MKMTVRIQWQSIHTHTKSAQSQLTVGSESRKTEWKCQGTTKDKTLIIIALVYNKNEKLNMSVTSPVDASEFVTRLHLLEM